MKYTIILILTGLSLLMMFGCSGANSAGSNTNAAENQSKIKGIPVKDLCQMINDPLYEKRDFNEDDCFGETFFGIAQTADYSKDVRPHLTLITHGREKIIHHILLTFSNYEKVGGIKLFVEEVDRIAKINNKPLPKELAERINSSQPGDTTDRKVKDEIAEYRFEQTSGSLILTIDFLQ